MNSSLILFSSSGVREGGANGPGPPPGVMPSDLMNSSSSFPWMCSSTFVAVGKQVHTITRSWGSSGINLLTNLWAQLIRVADTALCCPCPLLLVEKVSLFPRVGCTHKTYCTLLFPLVSDPPVKKLLQVLFNY